MKRDKIIKQTSVEFVEFVEKKRLFATNTIEPFKEYRMFDPEPFFDEFSLLHPEILHWHGLKSFVINLGHYARYCGYSYQLRMVGEKRLFRFFPLNPVAEKMLQRAANQFIEGVKTLSTQIKK